MQKKYVIFVIVVFESCVSFARKAFFYLEHHSASIDVDAIENHVNPMHIIIDMNQEF